MFFYVKNLEEMKMLEVKEYLETKDRKYPLCMTLNVMENIQKEYGSMTRWQRLMLGEKEERKVDKKGKEYTVWNSGEEPDIQAIKFFLTEGINEGIDIENENLKEKRDFINMRQAGRIMTEVGLKIVLERITTVMKRSQQESNDINEKN